ncbi:hypothetical protein [Litchfieldella xinjiangensis]|uniref:hypothetical protein n=1 Tax=Litchfieldella xinjiangensis TaxID=1166948 RepID=UPI0018CCEBD7|nr:hypothetical protein [Halomonas xinjiangensis]
MQDRKPRHGATRRRPSRAQRSTGPSLDMWLDRLVDIAVTMALIVGMVALAVTYL